MKVSKFEKIERFKNFSLIKRRGGHSSCTFSFVSAKQDDFYNMIGTNVEVTDGNRILMFAFVSDVTFILGKSENIVEVTLVSTSKRVDLDSYTRIFQKEKQTYKDILDDVLERINYTMDVPVSLKEAKLEYPIVQLSETDFEFVKRLIQEAYGQEIVTDVENKKIFVGYIENTKHEIKLKEIFSISQKKNAEAKIIEFIIRGDLEGQELREHVNIGKQIIWQGDTFIITRIEIKKGEGVYRYKCFAVCGDIKKQKKESVLKTFKAKVIEVEDPENLGRVRLDLSDTNIEDVTTDNKIWCHVLTPYTAKTGGFVFVPDIDDIVETIWNGSEFIITGCIRQKPLAERYQDVKLKQIGNTHDKNICLSEDSIEITTKEASVTMLDGEMHFVQGETEINIFKEKVDIRTKKSAMEMNDDYVLKTNKIHVDSDILEEKIKKNYTCESKNITINASATAVIEGKQKVSIN